MSSPYFGATPNYHMPPYHGLMLNFALLSPCADCVLFSILSKVSPFFLHYDVRHWTHETWDLVPLRCGTLKEISGLSPFQVLLKYFLTGALGTSPPFFNLYIRSFFCLKGLTPGCQMSNLSTPILILQPIFHVVPFPSGFPKGSIYPRFSPPFTQRRSPTWNFPLSE